MPPKQRAPRAPIANTAKGEPRKGTPKASRPKPRTKIASTTMNTMRMSTIEPRKSLRRMGVATRRFRSFLMRMSTRLKPTPHIPPLMMFMPRMPGIRKSM